MPAASCAKEEEEASTHMPTALTAGPAMSSGRRPTRSAKSAAGTLHASLASAVHAVSSPTSAALRSRLRASCGSTGNCVPCEVKSSVSVA